jgi:DNA modification methylase
MNDWIANKIEHWPIDKLIPYARNARTHSSAQIDQIAASIAEFGFTNPILVGSDGVIVAGHGRLEAARKLGMQTVPVIVLDHLTPTQRRALVIADNRIAENAEWDMEMLSLELAELQELDYDLELMGFSDKELAALLSDVQEVDGLTDPDDIPETKADAITKPGDIWLLGEHRLMCGDSTDADSVVLLMNGEKADICFTSPPYGAANVAKIRDHYKPGVKSRKSFYDQYDDSPDKWLNLMCGWYRLACDWSDVVICNVQMLADNKVAMIEWLYEVRRDLCDIIIWDKGNGPPQMQSNVMNNVYEFIFVMGGNGSRSIPFGDFHGTVQNIVRINTNKKNKFADVHRAVFPVELPLWVIKTLCTKALSVYEPFAGTGTTIIAAEQTGRRCYAMEISPQYVDVAVRRWQNFTGREAILEDTGQTYAEVMLLRSKDKKRD